jgi:hypothetical protein
MQTMIASTTVLNSSASLRIAVHCSFRLKYIARPRCCTTTFIIVFTRSHFLFPALPENRALVRRLLLRPGCFGKPAQLHTYYFATHAALSASLLNRRTFCRAIW